MFGTLFQARLLSIVTIFAVHLSFESVLYLKVSVALVLTHYLLGYLTIGKEKLLWTLNPLHFVGVASVLGLAFILTKAPTQIREAGVLIHIVLTDIYIGEFSHSLSRRLQLQRFVITSLAALTAYRHFFPIREAWLMPGLLCVAFLAFCYTLFQEDVSQERKKEIIVYEALLVSVALGSLLLPFIRHMFWIIVWYHGVIWFWYPLCDRRSSTDFKLKFCFFFAVAFTLFYQANTFFLTNTSGGKLISFFGLAHVLLTVLYSSQQPAWLTGRVRRLVFSRVQHK